jgi:hypothetical protein
LAIGLGENPQLARNTGGTAASNVRILAITNITSTGATFVHSTASGTPPYIVPGAVTLAPGGSTGFNLSFQATSGSASAPFSFTITASADNVPQFTQTITVP